MNSLWFLAFLLLPLLGAGYVFTHIWMLLPLSTAWRTAIVCLLGICLFSFFANFGLFGLDRWPMPLATATYQVGTGSLIVLLYAVMLFLVLDLGRLVHLVPASFLHGSWKGTGTVVGFLLITFTAAYFQYMHKVRQPVEMKTHKVIDKPMTIVMISDLHVGYLNHVNELNRWVDLVNSEKPDLVLIGGDIIDGHLRPLRDENAAAAFRRIQAPVVACLGNHEYYGGIDEADDFYKQAGIILLRDQAISLKGLNIIGRDDRTNPRRKPLADLMHGLDRTRYTILLDHQPYHLEEAERQGIDFQFSGHTHRGQVWPLNWITDAVYEDSFGPLQKGGTQYYVSSGIGIWGAKFRIGTRSEYVVGRLDQQTNPPTH